MMAERPVRALASRPCSHSLLFFEATQFPPSRTVPIQVPYYGDKRVPRRAEQDAMIDELLAELHKLERRLTIPSISEVIRLLESEKFDQLTSEQIRCVGEYQPIEIEDELFFDKAFTTGKEVAASLALSRYIGREVVLEDFVRLRATASGPTAFSC